MSSAGPRRLPALVERVAAVGALRSDSDEERIRKGTLTLAAALTAVLGVVWGVTYWSLGLRLAAAFPLGYAVFSLLSLALFVRTKRYRVFRFTQLLLMLLLPTLLQWALGGFVASSAVILWALMAPLGALMYQGSRAALWWLAAYIALVGASGILHVFIPSDAGVVPQGVIVTFFVLNVAGLSASSFFLLRYFVHARERAAQALAREREKSEALLLNVLPGPVADRLKAGEVEIADSFPEATVLFADIVGFTPLSAGLSPEDVVRLLDEVFTSFDGLAHRLGLEKIKTIGDAYMVAGGIPVPRRDHAEAVAEMALAMREACADIASARGSGLAVRIGMDSGPVVAGVIGRSKFIYDLWGDTVNTASRMEAHGLPGEIQVTAGVCRRLDRLYELRPRGTVDVKGKGPMETYLLVGRRSERSTPGSPRGAAPGSRVP